MEAWVNIDLGAPSELHTKNFIFHLGTENTVVGEVGGGIGPWLCYAILFFSTIQGGSSLSTQGPYKL